MLTLRASFVQRLPDHGRPDRPSQDAFCCAGCPAQWDKLTDAEKDAKLKVSLAPAGK